MFSYLGISVENLLNLDILKGSKVLAGMSGTAKRITKVNVMEVPDIIEWVSDGEFLITTAYSIKDNISALLDIIPKLKEKGVVGLGIKVGRYVSELPLYIIELADKLDFPIIELPFCVSHTDLISVILTEVINNQMNMLINIEEFNREIMDIMMRGGGLKEIGKKLYDNIGNSLAIYESMQDSTEIFCEDITHISIIEKIIYNYISSKNSTFHEDGGKKYDLNQDNFNGKYIERRTIPIVIDNVDYGFIFIWLDDRVLSPIDNMLIESYVHIIALEFVKRLSLYNMESNYKLEFFDNLLSSNKNNQANALEKAKNFNFNKELKYALIIISLKDMYKQIKQAENNMNLIQDSISSLMFIINRKIKHQNANIIYVDKSDRILILFGSENSKSDTIIKNEVKCFCEDILKETQKRFHKNQLIMGIGRAYKGVSELYKSHEQAKLIVENLSLAKIGNIIHYDDLGIYRILSYDGLQNELMEFCIDNIKPLIDYDKDNKTEFIKTLKIYFECNGNMKKISEKMYMHYNTIIYRLQKIREITGVNIDDSDSRLNLEIALKAIEVLKIN